MDIIESLKVRWETYLLSNDGLAAEAVELGGNKIAADSCERKPAVLSSLPMSQPRSPPSDKEQYYRVLKELAPKIFEQQKRLEASRTLLDDLAGINLPAVITGYGGYVIPRLPRSSPDFHEQKSVSSYGLRGASPESCRLF